MEAEASGSERGEAQHDDIEQHAPGGRRAGPSASSAAGNGHRQEGEDNADPDVAVRHMLFSSSASSSFLKKQKVSHEWLYFAKDRCREPQYALIWAGVCSCRGNQQPKAIVCCRTTGTAKGKTGSMRKSDKTMMWTWRERMQKRGMLRPPHQGDEDSSCATHASQNLHLPDSMQDQLTICCVC